MLAAVALVTTLVLVITGLLLWRLLAVIRADVLPIIDSARDTVDTLRGAVETVSEIVTDSAKSTPRVVRTIRRIAGLARGRIW